VQASATSTETPVAETPAVEPQREPVGAITGSPEPAPAPAPERTADAAPAPRKDLPHTAGFLPLLGLMGLGSLAGSRMMRRARQ